MNVEKCVLSSEVMRLPVVLTEAERLEVEAGGPGAGDSEEGGAKE